MLDVIPPINCSGGGACVQVCSTKAISFLEMAEVFTIRKSIAKNA